MANKYFLGTADTAAQVSTVQITAFDASTTYKITIGGEVVSVIGNTNVNTTASDLNTALNASTHPYFAAITWTVSTDTVTGTADTAGIPFVAVSSVTGGTGTIGAVTETTAAAGPNVWSTAENWSDGSVPVSTDDVTISNSSVNISWGLDQNAVTLASLTIDQTYTGKIGLRSTEFATSADSETRNTAKHEYRETYLKIGSDRIDIGDQLGVNVASGSQRLKINNVKSGASDNVINRTSSTSAETGLPAVRFLANHASADFFIRSANGGVGFAVDLPTETATIGDVHCSDDTTGSRIFISDGVTLTELNQRGGNNFLDAAATVATVTVNGGLLFIDGDYTITALTVNDGIVTDSHIKTSGVAVTTANINGGTYDLARSREARTITTLNHEGGTLLTDDPVTITTYNHATGLKQTIVQEA